MLMPSQQVLINPTLISAFETIYDHRRALFDRIEDYRAYTANRRYAKLSESQKALLGGDPQFSINLCPTILRAKTDRLAVDGMDVLVDGDDEMSETLTGMVWRWWSASDMDSKLNACHYQAARDGDAYLIIGHDGSRPTFDFEEAFDGELGTMMVYEDRRPVYAFKRWSYLDAKNKLGQEIQRLNLYYPDRIERYYDRVSGAVANLSGNWHPYTDEQHPEHIIPMVDADGNPLGIPVIHIRNEHEGDDYGVSDLRSIVPAYQDTLNRVGVATLAASLLAGFPINYLIGVPPNNDGTYSVYPGALITAEAGEGGINVGQFPAANLLQLIEIETNIKRTISMLTSTPLAMLNPTGQIAAAGTLQQMEMPLIARVQRAQRDYGNAYERAVRMAIKMDRNYNPSTQIPSDLSIDDLMIAIQWQSAKLADERNEAETLLLHQSLGIPNAFIWKKLGYTEDEIQEIEREKQREDLTAMRNQMLIEQSRATDTLIQANQGLEDANETNR